jgi:dGTP triphosphohydrolase
MNEFDLRKFLYNNPLMEKKEDSKKGNKEEQKRMEGAIRDDRDHIKDLKKDIEDNEKKLSKLKKDFKKDVNEGEESVDEKKMSNPDMRKKDDKGVKGGKEERKTLDDEPRYDKKLTKEGLKDMIREKITSILNEEEIEEQEDVDVEVDDVSKETDIDVKTSLPGESEDVDAVLGLLTKAKEESERFAAEDEELGTQIGNVITYFTRKHVAK